MLGATRDDDAAVRYWGAVGVGNIGEHVAYDEAVRKRMEALLGDSSASIARSWRGGRRALSSSRPKIFVGRESGRR